MKTLRPIAPLKMLRQQAGGGCSRNWTASSCCAARRQVASSKRNNPFERGTPMEQMRWAGGVQREDAQDRQLA